MCRMLRFGILTFADVTRKSENTIKLQIPSFLALATQSVKNSSHGLYQEHQTRYGWKFSIYETIVFMVMKPNVASQWGGTCPKLWKIFRKIRYRRLLFKMRSLFLLPPWALKASKIFEISFILCLTTSFHGLAMNITGMIVENVSTSYITNL